MAYVHLADKPVGYLGTLLVGIALGAGWSPCIGPFLGSILTYTASSADLGRGLLLLFAYILTSWIRLPYRPWLNRVQRFLYDVCDPYLRIFRRFLPPLGPLDLSADGPRRERSICRMAPM